MQTSVIIAGFGGQGVLFSGQLLSYAAMDKGFEVTWLPSYGPEMRGGTANCTVIVADEEIGSPLEQHPRAIIAMNLPSLNKFEEQVEKNGLLVLNQSMINREVVRKDIRVLLIPANEIAETLGDSRMSNMVLLGGLLANQNILPMEAVETALEEHLPKKHNRLLPLNIKAIHEGAKFRL